MSPQTARWAETTAPKTAHNKCTHTHVMPTCQVPTEKHTTRTLVMKDNRICYKDILIHACKFTIFRRLTKAVDPVPFIGKCHQFELFQNDIYVPCVRYEMVNVWSRLDRPIFYQICNSTFLYRYFLTVIPDLSLNIIIQYYITKKTNH